MKQDDRAIFYIAKGDNYVDEANKSALSVQAAMGDIKIFLFTRGNGIKTNIDNGLIVLDEPAGAYTRYWYLEHTFYMRRSIGWLANNGYKRVLYLDTDTYMIEPVYDIFDLLVFYDFLGTHAPGRETTSSVFNIPISYPEFNIGVNGMRTGLAMEKLWDDVFRIYDENSEIYGNNDQGALRDMLYGSSLMVHTLPPEYNLRFCFPSFASKSVKILHGRSDDIQGVAKIVNKSKEMRSWQGL